ncbi:hypothetical protein PybrP1_001493 [[Pythium] brassicae (nom. inval.)]|nr:hypothetical protein PybrP1_001493 [[Pythium] brassicae (nom. inval.)]
MSSLMQLKAQNESRLAEEKRLIDRKRNVLVLMLQYCAENGYLAAAEKLQQEAGFAISKFEVVENIDLLRIIQEYEEYQEMKFGKKPKLAALEKRNKRNEYSSPHMPAEARVENNAALKALANSLGASSGASGSASAATAKAASGNNNSGSSSSSSKSPQAPEDEALDLGLVGQKPAGRKLGGKSGKKAGVSSDEREDTVEERVVKPLPSFMLDSELRPLAETITREIFQKNPNVRWDDVIGLFETKRLLKEAVVMPLKYPQLFQGLLKYRGDSEKLIRLLFELARHHAPSTIFLDEIDSIMGQRDGGGGGGGGQEHEASRRMKTELLIQMDGLAKTNDVVFVLAASNLPWELDAAMLRRLEKRVLVALPSSDARRALLASLLAPYVAPEFAFEDAVARTNGYSGADIKLVAKEACMAPVRRLLVKLEASEASDSPSNGGRKVAPPRADAEWRSLLGPVLPSDLLGALEKTRPSAQQLQRKYEQWQTRFGST